MNLQYLTTTEAVDTAFFFIFAICAMMLLGITVAMVWFLIRYNRRRCPQPLSQKDKNIWLEIVWTVIPTVLVLAMFWYGWEGYLSLQRIPKDALEVHATARMWSWHFEYDNGKSSDRLYVPTGRPVKVRLESADVLHSFFVPAFRVKRDTVPGMTTWVWFTAEEPGSYDLFCAEYCGVGHSSMITTVEALPQERFAQWLAEKAPAEETMDPVALLQKYGCTGCHSLDGSKGIGPTFKGIAGSRRTIVRDGVKNTVIADREYIERAILEPGAELVQGFQPMMPSFRGTISEEELEIMVDFLSGTEDGKEQEEKGEGEAKEGLGGETLVREQGCLGCHSSDGSLSMAPTFKGLFGRTTTVIRDGSELTLTADEKYIRRSISEPGFDLVKGQQPIMPPFAHLSDEQIEAIIDYLKVVR